ncbi:hypothetical protein BMS3Bbin15_00632 [archaeon BMS3Bbin15]|nr:hypothetical protein BMS3Bbin15_00632 [archaeon BMS3Bbin15]
MKRNLFSEHAIGVKCESMVFFLKHHGKLLFHSEICDFQSLVSDKELDIKKDKSLIRKLFGRLQSSRTSRAEKIHRVLTSILKGQRTLPEIMSNTVNSALDFLRDGLLKVHKKTNTSIDFPEITFEMDKLYSLPTFKGRLEDLFRVIESSGLLKKAGLLDGDIPFFKAHAAMIKRDIRIFERLYLELEENSRFSHICDLYGYIPSPRSFGRFRERAIPSLEKLRDLLVKWLNNINAISFRVVVIDGKFKRSNTYAYPDENGCYSDVDAGLCFKGTYKRGPGYIDLKLIDVASEQPLCSVVFPGNRHESPFLQGLLEDFHHRYGCYPLFLLGDKAFFSFENVLYCIVRGVIPVLDSKKVKADDLIKVGTNHRYRKCVFGKFTEDVLNALARLRPSCERLF